MCKCLRGLKVPTGFSSNIWSLVAFKDMTLTSYNSHDYHVMITIFLATAIRAVKPVFLKMVITRMCYFFIVILQKVMECVGWQGFSFLCQKLKSSSRCAFIHHFWYHGTSNDPHGRANCWTIHVDSQWIHDKQGTSKGKHDRELPDRKDYWLLHIYYIKDKRVVGLLESRHEGRLSGKGTIGRKNSLTRTTNNRRKHVQVFYNNMQ
jgi:hypothetical protein